MDTKKYTLQGFRMDYLKITQKEFADKLGLDVVTVSKLENEKINFSMNKQKKIIQEYGVKIEEGKIIVSDNEYYRRGELRQLLEVNQEIIKQAKRGSSAHIKQLVEILKKKDIDNIL